jgi:predicted metalloprotease with PDZ domain
MVNISEKSLFRYTVIARNTREHIFEIRLQFISEDPESTLSLPAWTPGSYTIRDYSRNLFDFHSNQKWEQTDLSEFKIYGKGEIEVRYKIYAYEELSVRTNHLDEDFGLIAPAGLFLFQKSERNPKIQVRFDLGTKFQFLYTSKQFLNPQDHGYELDSWDDLFDTPILISNTDLIQFSAGSVSHGIVIQGASSDALKQGLVSDLAKVIDYETQCMGKNPNQKYLFILLLIDGQYGGLEHLESSVNIFDPLKLDERKEYLKLLELLAHEYFHLWNVKRIRPIALGPFDYSKPNLTRELWIAEGITSFYDAYFLLRTGLLTTQEYLEKITEDFLNLEDSLGDELMSLEESSFTAWNKLYKRNLNSHNNSISYYTKGSVLALCIHLRILRETGGKTDLSYIMRALYSKFYEEEKRGFTKSEFFETIREVTGLDLRQEFDPYLVHARRIPLPDYLDWIGVRMIDEGQIPDPGFQVRENGGSLIINKVFNHRLDQEAELYLGDEILGIDGNRVKNLAQWNKLWESTAFMELEKHHLLITRKGKLKEIPLRPGKIGKNRKFIFDKESSKLRQELVEKFFQ